MDRLQERRKNYYIGKKFQRRFIFKFCLLVIAGSLISGAMIYLMSGTTVTTIFDNARLTIKSTSDFILPSVLLASLIMIVLIGLATIFMTLFTSHRIAGPLYRMEKDIDEVAAGNLTKVFNLRASDELKAMAASLNALVHSLASKIAPVKSMVDELSAMSTGDQAKEKIKQIKKELDKFSV